ncbi:MAG: phosphodiester glycosidase family protein [Bacilli bacterium]|nr:phosphodiester glycosidase family protein [Bacilli bacterium]
MSKKKKRKKILKRTIFFIIIDLLAIDCFFIMYGPYDYFRNLYVSTAMNTMNHQWLAKVFFSDKKIEKMMSNNYFVTIDEDVNTDDIIINTKEKTKYKDEYEKELLTRDPDNDLYKLLEFKIGGSNAYLVAIYDPTKVHLISTRQFNVGGYGERILTMCERYGGKVCINAGGFVDNGMGSDIPLGYVIKDKKILWSSGYSTDIIGITEDGKLKLLANSTGEEAIEKGVVDGLTFSPFLIVNGKELEIHGDPWGSSPRMAIAQRKDGVMMFLAIDGENYINGATLKDVITVLKRYGAYNAANLDGGTSATMIIEDRLINNPAGGAKKTRGRYVVTGWGLIP